MWGRFGGIGSCVRTVNAVNWKPISVVGLNQQLGGKDFWCPRKSWAEDVDLGIISEEIVFKVKGLDEII